MFNGYGDQVASMYKGMDLALPQFPTSNNLSSWAIPPAWNPSVRAGFFVSCLLPFMALAYSVATNALGPDPAEHLMHVTGEWVMRFMVLVLAATPLARWGWPRLARYRRMLGLYAWFYATLHLLVFAQVYIGWAVRFFWRSSPSVLTCWWASLHGSSWCRWESPRQTAFVAKWDAIGESFTAYLRGRTSRMVTPFLVIAVRYW